jgi:hypothetical protein
MRNHLLAILFLLVLTGCKKDTDLITARLMVVNTYGSPVTVTVNNNTLATGLAYANNSGYQNLNSGLLQFAVQNATNNNLLYTANLYGDPGKTYTLFANGNSSFNATLTYDTLPEIKTDSAYLRYLNFADDTLTTKLVIDSLIYFSSSYNKTITRAQALFLETTARRDTFYVLDKNNLILLDSVFTMDKGKAYTYFLSGSIVPGAARPLQLNRITNN